MYVNYFNGGEKDRVEYRIDDGRWRRMAKVTEPDPSYVRMTQSWDANPDMFTGKRPSNPVDCTHLWKVRLPNRLPAGRHTIEVRVTDMFGRTFTGFSTYRVVEQ